MSKSLIAGGILLIGLTLLFGRRGGNVFDSPGHRHDDARAVHLRRSSDRRADDDCGRGINQHGFAA